jgi:hypothetical protein
MIAAGEAPGPPAASPGFRVSRNACRCGLLLLRGLGQAGDVAFGEKPIEAVETFDVFRNQKGGGNYVDYLLCYVDFLVTRATYVE